MKRLFFRLFLVAILVSAVFVESAVPVLAQTLLPILTCDPFGYNAYCPSPTVSPETVKNIIAISRIRAALKPVVDSPAVKVATIVTAVAATGSVVASIGALTSGIPSLFSPLLQTFHRIWQGLLSIFGFKRKKRPWGRVVDADSGDPIAGAHIRVYDHQAKQLKDTIVSNDRGLFSLVVPPGSYEFRVQKPGWVLTPKAPYLHLLAGEHVFDGKPVTVTQSQLLSLVIAMRLSETIPFTGHLAWRRVFQTAQLFIARLSWPLLLLGLALNSATLFVELVIINIIIQAVYVILVGWKIWLHFLLKPSVGYVRDANTQKPLDLAFVRVYNAETGRLVETRTTGIDGKFLLLPSPGVYTILVVRAGYESYRESHVVVNSKSEALAFLFALTPTDTSKS